MSEAIGAPPEALSPSHAAPSRAADMTTRWRLLLLIALVLASLLPGFFSIPVVDRDETRYAQASRQMVESGDYVVPRLGEANRFKKPIGIYWLQVAAVKLTGHGADAPIWVFRLPSLAAALLAVLLTFAIGRRLFDERTAFFAAALLGTSLILAVEGRLAKTDAAQLASAVAGQLALARFYLAGAQERLRLGWVLLFWGAMAAAILIKGPIVPMLTALTAVTLTIWDRRAAWLKRLRPAIGLPFLLLLVLPWLIAIAVQAGPAFFHESVGVDLLSKVAKGQEFHGAPPGAHFAAFWIAFWPGAALVAIAVPSVWANRASPAVRFCVAWLVPFWIVFELIATKLPHYTLPAYPALALLAAAGLTAPRAGRDPLWTRLLVAVAAIGGGLTAIAGPVLLYLLEQRLPLLPLAVAALVVLMAGYAVRQAFVAGVTAAVRVLLVEAPALYLLLFGLVAPQADRLWIAPRLEAAITRVACPGPQVMVAGFSEPSVMFVLGQDVQIGDGVKAADFLAQPGCRVVVVADHQQQLFDIRNQVLGRSPTVATTTNGINSANSRRLSFNVYVSPERKGSQP